MMRNQSIDPSWDALVAQTGWMRRLAARLIQDPNRADDLVQDAWVRVLSSPPGSTRPMRPWLHRVLVNLARKAHRTDSRRRSRELASMDPHTQSSTHDVIERLEHRRLLATLLLDLPEPYRTTIICRYIEGLKAREIAAIQQIPEPTVRWRIQQGLARLRRKLDDQHGGKRHVWVTALFPISRAPGRSTTAIALTAVSVCCVSWMLLVPTNDPPSQTAVNLAARSSGELSDPVSDPDLALSRAMAESPDPADQTTPPQDAQATVTATVKARFVDERGSPLAGVRLYRTPESVGISSGIAKGTVRDPSLAAQPHAIAQSQLDGTVTLDVLRSEEDRRNGTGRQWSALFETEAVHRSTRQLDAIVSADRVTHLGTLVLRGAAKVVGHVRDQTGRPISGIQVLANANTEEYWSPGNAVRHRGDRIVSVSTRTDSEGRYELTSIPSDLAFLFASGLRRIVSLPPGGSGVIDFEIPVADHQGQFRCAVVDPSGQPVTDGRITHRRPGDRARSSGSTGTGSTSRDGSFYLAANETGRIDLELWVKDEGGRYAQRVFTLGTPLDNLRTIELQEADLIEIHVRTCDGDPIEDFSAQLVAGRRGVLDTAYSHHSPDGRWEVRRPVQTFEVQLDARGYRSV